MILDRYRLEEAIGAGAYGTVWLAHDERLDRVVAVKAIPAELAGERAEREIRAAARLTHPGVVTLHEATSDETHTYLVSEFVRGLTLKQLYADGHASDRDVARIGAALSAALDHAHDHGVIHRDIKPGNVLIPDAPRSEAGIVKLADFGIARLAGDATVTLTGDVVGTLAYMSPEQATGDEVGFESDVWSLGIVIHEGLAGRNPVRGRTPAETARNLTAGDVELLGTVRPDLPDDLLDVVEAALEPEPGDRCSLAELEESLAASVAVLNDEPGCIGPALRRQRRIIGRRSDNRVARIPVAPDPEFEAAITEPASAGDPATQETAAQGRPLSARPPDRTDRLAEPSDRGSRGPSRTMTTPVWGQRLPAALFAGVLAVLWATQIAPSDTGLRIWPTAAAVAFAVMMLPRLGWISAVVAAALYTRSAGASGTALVLLISFLPGAVLMWRSPEWWSVPSLAPTLGVPGMSGAWPAVASFGSGVWLRAAAGAAGAWQICCAQLLLGQNLMGSKTTHIEPVSHWSASAGAAITDAILPMLHGQAPAFALLWAVAAVALPIVVSGRSAMLDALAAIGWSVALSIATFYVAGGMTRGVLAGSLAGAAVVVARRGIAVRRNQPVTGGRPPTMVSGLDRLQ